MTPVFAGVVLLHGGLFISSQLWSASAVYSVQEAPVSIDFIAVPAEVQKEKLDRHRQERIQKYLKVEKSAPEKSETQKVRIDELLRQEEAIQGAIEKPRPHAIRNKPPVYPRIARQKGWEGTVILRVYVSDQGKPIRLDVEKSSGYRLLDQAALRAVGKWSFIPASDGWINYGALVKIPVRFILKGQKSGLLEEGV